MNQFYNLPRANVVISPVTKESCGLAFGTTGWTSTTWPSTNKAILMPFVLYQPFIVRLLFTFNGGIVSGNLDIGIYDMGRSLRVHTGAKPQAGTNLAQAFQVPETELTPGCYWLAMAMDNTVGQVYRRAAGLGSQAVAFGVTQVIGNMPLAENIVGQLSRLSTANMPFMACSSRNFV